MTELDPRQYAGREIAGGANAKFRIKSPLPAIIAADIELAEGEHEKLAAVIRTPMNFQRGAELLAQAQRAAAEKLCDAGAIIISKGSHTSLHFRGLTASSDRGLLGALINWAQEARVKLAETGETAE